MLNPNKHNTKPKLTLSSRAYHRAQLSYTAQNSSGDLCSYLQTVIIAQMLYIAGEGNIG